MPTHTPSRAQPRPAPFVVHVNRAAFVYPRLELRSGDAERVRAGMEVCHFEYGPDDWEVHLRECGRRLLARGAGAGLGAAVAFVVASNQLTPKTADEHVYDKLLEYVAPDRVLLTSTGVLFGAVARLWRGRGYQLASAAVEPGESSYLVLTFKRWWSMLNFGRHELWIPIPGGMVEDISELSETLTA